MTDLLDIAPATAYDVVLTSDGRRVKVRGLRSNDIATIATRFRTSRKESLLSTDRE